MSHGVTRRNQAVDVFPQGNDVHIGPSLRIVACRRAVTFALLEPMSGTIVRIGKICPWSPTRGGARSKNCRPSTRLQRAPGTFGNESNPSCSNELRAIQLSPNTLPGPPEKPGTRQSVTSIAAELPSGSSGRRPRRATARWRWDRVLGGADASRAAAALASCLRELRQNDHYRAQILVFRERPLLLVEDELGNSSCPRRMSGCCPIAAPRSCPPTSSQPRPRYGPATLLSSLTSGQKRKSHSRRACRLRYLHSGGCLIRCPVRRLRGKLRVSALVGFS